MEEEGRVGGKFIPCRCYTGTVYRDGEREEIVLTDGNDRSDYYQENFEFFLWEKETEECKISQVRNC